MNETRRGIDRDLIIMLLIIAIGSVVYVVGFSHLSRFISALLVPPEKPTANIYFSCAQGNHFQALVYSSNVHLHLQNGTDVIVPKISSTTYQSSNNSLLFIYDPGSPQPVVLEQGPHFAPLYINCTPGTNNYS